MCVHQVLSCVQIIQKILKIFEDILKDGINVMVVDGVGGKIKCNHRKIK